MSDDESEIRELEPGMSSIARLPWEEARLLAGRLESEGFKTKVFPEAPEPAIGGVLPMPALDLMLHDVLVETGRLDDARKVAKDIVQE
jgi:hypothetical protein